MMDCQYELAYMEVDVDSLAFSEPIGDEKPFSVERDLYLLNPIQSGQALPDDFDDAFFEKLVYLDGKKDLLHVKTEPTQTYASSEIDLEVQKIIDQLMSDDGTAFSDLPICGHQSTQPFASSEFDLETQELMDQLMRDDIACSDSKVGLQVIKPVQPKNRKNQVQLVLSATATTSPEMLPMLEEQQQQQQHYQPRVNQQQQPHTLESPTSPTSSSADSFELSVPADREAEIDCMAAYIKGVIEHSNSFKPDEMSSKLKVHEVILAILLNSTYGDRTKDLRRILAFCDENGREVSGEGRHFKTLDTETMGLLWKKIKGNSKSSYDTFARAMRVRREKSTGYFEYLDSGRRSKKRIYRFGDKAMVEMSRMKLTLRQFSEPRSFV